MSLVSTRSLSTHAGTLAAVKLTDQMIAAAKAAGVEVTVSTRPKREGEIVPLPGLRPKGSA